MRPRAFWVTGWILILLALGLYSGEKIFFVGLFILFSMMLYSILSNLWVLLDFKYLQAVSPETATKGQKAELLIQIHNDKPFVYPFLKVYYKTPEDVMTGNTKEHLFFILPYSYQELKEGFICQLRGRYPLGLVRVEVGDLFGLFTFSINLEKKVYHKQLYLNVKPRILSLSRLPLPYIQQEGSLNQQLLNTEEAATIADIRQIRYGDPLKKIHWNVSSKFQELYVKNYETTSQPEVIVFMDTRPYGTEGITRYEVEDQIIECTTAIIQHMLSKWLALSLILYNKERYQMNGKNPYDFEHIFNFLSELEFDGAFSMTDILTMESGGFKRGGSIILVVHQMTPDLYNRLCIYKQSGIDCTVFLVRPREADNRELLRMMGELNNHGIAAISLYTDERLDEVLETMMK